MQKTNKPLSIVEFIHYLNTHNIKLWVDAGRLRYRAPKGAMTAPIRAQVAERKQEILTFLQENQASTIQPIARDKPIPMSFAQQQLWFLDQLQGPNATYNVFSAIRLQGLLNINALQETFNEIIRRHESLRTTFITLNGQPVQNIAPSLTIPLHIVELGHLLEPEQAATIKQLTEAEAKQPFDLAQGPLLRLTLLDLNSPEAIRQTNDLNYILLFSMHHIIADRWSMEVFIKEATTLYKAFIAAQPSPLPDLPIQYADYAHWQRQYFSGTQLEEQLAYWKKQLGPTLPTLKLPLDHPRTTDQTHKGARQSFQLAQDTSQKLRDLSHTEGVTMFPTLLAAFKTLLHWYSGQHDIVVGTDVANRNTLEVEGLIGFFVNQLVLRTNLAGNPSFQALIGRVKEMTLAAFAHQELPFDKVVEALNPKRVLGMTPLFQAKMVLQSNTPSDLDLPGLTWFPLKFETETAKFDLLLDIWDEEAGVRAEIEYNTGLFNEATIIQMLKYFELILNTVSTNPDISLVELTERLNQAAEQHQSTKKKQLQKTSLRKLKNIRRKTIRK